MGMPSGWVISIGIANRGAQPYWNAQWWLPSVVQSWSMGISTDLGLLKTVAGIGPWHNRGQEDIIIVMSG